MHLRSPLLALCISLSLAVPSAAFAQAVAQASDADKATARVLGQEGQEALDKKDFKTAEDRFKRADSLFHAPTLALGLARAYVGNGKYVAAQEAYNRILREGLPPGASDVFKRALADATTELAQVSPKIGNVTITVTGPDTPKVTIDDAPVPAAALGIKRAVDPGAHVVKASAEGFKPAETTVTVAPGGSTTAALALEKDASAVVASVTTPNPLPAAADATRDPTATPPPDAGPTKSGSSAKTMGFVALGVGAVGLAAGAVTGLMALGKASDLSDACPGGTCAADQQDAIDGYETLGLVSTIGFGVGIAGVGAGIILLVTAPKEAKASAATGNSFAVTPYVGFGTVGATGRF